MLFLLVVNKKSEFVLRGLDGQRAPHKDQQVFEHAPAPLLGASGTDAPAWIAINGLLSASRADNMLITRQELDEVVRRSDKQRFSFDPAGTMIRANQGHTVQIDLELTESRPPAMLYHGSSKRSERSLAAQSQDETTLRAFVNGRKHRNGSQFAAWQTNSI